MFQPVQIYERIKQLLCKKGISDRQMMADAGVKRGVLDNMKNGSMPSADKLSLIADYLQVSIDYLLGRDAEDDTEENAEGSMFWERFYAACKERGTSPTAVCLEIGLSNATATGWRHGTQPRADVLAKLARYLSVSVDYLLGIDIPAQADDKSGDMIAMKGTRAEWAAIMSKMTDEQLLQLRDYAEFLIAKNKDDKQ